MVGRDSGFLLSRIGRLQRGGQVVSGFSLGKRDSRSFA